MKINSLVKIIPVPNHIKNVKKHYNKILVINNISRSNGYNLKVLGSNYIIVGESMPISFRKEELRQISVPEIAKMKIEGLL